MSAPPPPSVASPTARGRAPPPPMARIPSTGFPPPSSSFPPSSPSSPSSSASPSSVSFPLPPATPSKSEVRAPPPPASKTAPTPPPPTPRPPPPTPKPSSEPNSPINPQQKGPCSTLGCLRAIQSDGKCVDHARGPPYSSHAEHHNDSKFSSLSNTTTSRFTFRSVSAIDDTPSQQWQTKANRQSMRQFECWKALELTEPGTRVGKKCVIVGDACRSLQHEGWSIKSLLLATFNNNDSKEFAQACESLAPHEHVVNVDGTSVTLQLWDTSGQENDEKLRQLAYFQASVFVLVFSRSSRESYDNAKNIWATELRQLAPGVPIVLVGVNTDTTCVSVYEREGWQLAFHIQDCLEFFECDATSKDSISAIFDHVARITLGKPAVVTPQNISHSFRRKDVHIEKDNNPFASANIPGRYSAFCEGPNDFKYSAFLGDRLFVASNDTVSTVGSDSIITKMATWFRDISGIAFRGKDLFVACSENCVISRVSLTGKVTEYAHPPLVRGLSGIAALGEDVIVGCWVGGLVVKVSSGSLTCLAQGSCFRAPLSFAVYADMVYCANENDGTIYKIPLNGSGAFTTFACGFVGPTSLAFLGEDLFVTNKADGSISKVSLDGSVTRFASGLKAPSSVGFVGDDLYIVQSDSIYKVSIPVWANALENQDAVQICALISVANSLCLRQCVDNAGAALLAQCLETNNFMRVLDLDQNLFDDEGALALAKLLETHPLISLSMAGNQIGDLGAMAFGKLFNYNNTLQHLILSSNKIGLAGAMSMIEGIMRSKVITKVDLADNPLPKSWIALVGALAQMQELGEVSLAGVGLTSAQLFLLAEKLKTNTTLRSLRLENNHITEETAAALWNALNWQLAVRLGLMDEDNKDILKPVNKVPSLTTIAVTGRSLYTPRLPPPSKGVSVLSLWLEGFSYQVKYYYWGQGQDESRSSEEDTVSSSDGDDTSDSETEAKWPRLPPQKVHDSDSDGERLNPLRRPAFSDDDDSDNEIVQFNREIFTAARQAFTLKKLNKPPPYLVLETGEFAEDMFKTIVSTHPKVFARDGPRNHKRLSYYDSCDATLRSVINSVQLFCGRFLFQSTLPEYKSAHSVILRATDSSLGASASEVVLKLFRNEAQFRREVDMRNALNGQFVSEVMCSSEMFRDWASTVDRFCGVNFKYGIVLEAGQRDLQTILVHERMSLGAVRDCLQACIKCLQSVHQAGRIHGNIKPLHFLRMSDHTWRLAGFSCISERNGVMSTKVLSTAYAPPESAEGNNNPVKMNVSFDMWSLGCILFRALTRKSLFEADDEDNLRNTSEQKHLSQWNTRSLAAALIEAGDILRTTIQSNFDDIGDSPSPVFRRLAALDLLGWLLQRDPSWRPSSCELVLEHAFFKGEAGLMFMSNLHLLAGLGNARQIDRELLSSTQHPVGKTALHTAAEEGHLQAVNALLAAGASLEALDGLGNTALQSSQHLLNHPNSEFGKKLVPICDRFREVSKS